MRSVWVDVVVVIALILLEALFVAAEIALVSLRESQIAALERRGRRGAAVARLARDPNRFLSAVQIAITLTSLLSSAFGAVTLAHATADGLVSLGVTRDTGNVLGFLLVTIAISFVTLVIGELVPKRLALQRAEGTARLIAPTLDRLARFLTPVIALLSVTTNAIVRLLGGDPKAARESMSEEELRGLVTSHEALGRDERQLIDEVFTAGDRRLREVLVPRTEVEFLDATMPVGQALAQLRSTMHSRYPVFRGSHDEIIGMVHVRDLLAAQAENRGRTVRVGDLVRPVKLLPDGLGVLQALSEMRREGHRLAVVVDEYGGTAGIVTLEDLVEEIIGEIRDEHAPDGTDASAPGEMIVDGLTHTEDFAEETGIRLPDGPYETVAGFMLAALGHIPGLGEWVDVDGYRFTVAELDGRRVAKIKITRRPAEAGTAARAALGE